MKVSDSEIIEACEKSETMAEAARYLGVNFKTLKARAIKLNCYRPNQFQVGVSDRKGGTEKKDIEDILSGKYPKYPTTKLRIRLIKEGYKIHQCEKCKLSEWNGKSISLELNHKDGNKHNHKLDNLEILCPNCHAQTPTYRGKNTRKARRNRSRGEMAERMA